MLAIFDLWFRRATGHTGKHTSIEAGRQVGNKANEVALSLGSHRNLQVAEERLAAA